MRAQTWMEFSGIEIANFDRLQDYLANGHLPLPITSLGCGCSFTDEGPYNSPASDPAPWLSPDNPESEDFLGMLAYDIRIDPVITRTVTPKFLGGGTVGKMRPKPRIVSVLGLMFAATEHAMSYGERWLTSVLAGVVVGCAPDTLRVLLACPGDEDTPPFRTLYRVGIVDGPNFGAKGELPECHIQEVQFQIAAGNPYLVTDGEVCMDGVSLVGGS